MSKPFIFGVATAGDNFTSYVQQFAWLVWVQTDRIATEENFTAALQDLLDQNSVLFQRETQNLGYSVEIARRWNEDSEERLAEKVS